jgi:hypothetical protein
MSGTLAHKLGTLARATFLSLLLASTACAGPITVHGLLDVVQAEHSRAREYNVLIRGDSPFDAYGLRLFGDVDVSERVQVFSQVVLRDATQPYVDGAYVMFTPSADHDLHLLAGKIPWLIGTYAPRTYSNKNPLIGAPLMYQARTTLVWYDLVPNPDALLATAGTGHVGVDYHGYTEGMGMTLVDDSYWDVGVTLTGSARPLEYAAGVVSGTPGWGSTSRDENSGKSVLARLGLAPSAGLRVGVSAAYGPYLIQELSAYLPPGRSVNDYHQKIGMADLEWSFGRVETHAEAARNIWETPTVGKLAVDSGYLELRYAMGFGLYLAGRFDAMRFGDVAGSDGVTRRWDSDLTRIETGAGFRIDRHSLAKVVYQRTAVENPTATQPDAYSMVAAQLSISF